MTYLSRRGLMRFAVAAFSLGAVISTAPAQEIDELVIAYNVNLPSWDPTVGLSAVNPTLQGIYQSVFDQFIAQAHDLQQKPGILTEWDWNEDKSKIQMTVRDGVTWHDGTPLTAEDLVWSLERAGNQDSGNPIEFIWSTIGNYSIDGNKIIADVLRFEPTIFKWMSFLTGYVMPKAYIEKVGIDGFQAAPIGSGPYMVDKYERNAFVRLKANPDYWGGKPEFNNVTIKFVTDAASPRRGGGIRQFARHTGNAVRRIRPAEGWREVDGNGRSSIRHRHDLLQRRRCNDGPQCAQGSGHGGRQERHRRPPALWLRGSDRYAADAILFGL